MKNHIHLITTSNNTINFVRGFKGYTSKEMKNNILKTEPQLLSQLTNKKGEYQFWEKTNMPLYIEFEHFFLQKLNYIHENPVRKGYVEFEEDWYWSSANMQCKLPIDKSSW